MAEKRKYQADVGIIPSKRMKKEYQSTLNKFQKLIFQLGYKKAQQRIVNLYLKERFNAYVIPLIKVLIYEYYCQVNICIIDIIECL